MKVKILKAHDPLDGYSWHIGDIIDVVESGVHGYYYHVVSNIYIGHDEVEVIQTDEQIAYEAGHAAALKDAPKPMTLFMWTQVESGDEDGGYTVGALADTVEQARLLIEQKCREQNANMLSPAVDKYVAYVMGFISGDPDYVFETTAPVAFVG